MKRTILAVLLTAVAGWAQDGDDASRGVARISLIDGDVSVRRGDSGEWIAAGINAPLVVTDRLITGANSRAEVQLDYANMARLSSNTEVRFSDLENRRYQIQLAKGMVTFSVLRDSDADVEISTPQVSVRPAKKGDYRIVVFEDGRSEITVRKGAVEIFTPTGSRRLESGQTMLARGSASDPEYQVTAAIARDGWDEWNDRRNGDLERRAAAHRNYMGSGIYGYEDLDGHGRWISSPEYGSVWAPSVAPGWAPYRHGRWTWIDWYGWSWMSDDPWGWAPYHYGRWYMNAGIGWCWWPGYRHTRHYWSPGYVAFFGWGSHSGFGASAGFGWGNVGWVPLAPYEPYYPWYGRGYYGGYRGHTTFVNNNTIVNNYNIRNVYRNARMDNAVTAVVSDQFGRGAVRNVRFSGDEMTRASLVRGQLPVAPDRASLRVADAESRLTARSADDGARFYSRKAATAVDRVPFEQQRQTMEQVSRRTFGQDTPRGGGVRPGESATSPTPVERVGSDRSGWRRVGESPSRGDLAGGSGKTEPRTVDQGWQKVGEGTTRGSAARQEGSFGGRVDSGSGGRTVDRGTMNSGTADRGGWNRFGDPGDRVIRMDAPPRREPDYGRTGSSTPDRAGGSRSPAQGDSWGRFGSIGGSGSRTPDAGVDRSSGRGSSGSSGSIRSEPRSERPRFERNSGGSEPSRISPPVVRERPSTRSESFGGYSRGSFGSSGGSRGGDSGGGRVSSGSRSADGGGGRISSAPPSGGGAPSRGSMGGGSPRISGGDGGSRSGGGGGHRGR